MTGLRFAAQFDRITSRYELGIARKRADLEMLKSEAALLQAGDYKRKATEAEQQLSDQVTERLRELSGGAAQASSAAYIPQGISLPEQRPATGKKKQARFSTFENGFLADKSREGGYSGQTVAQVHATFRLWVELMGDRPVDEYTGGDAGRFRDLLLRMPASHGKGGRINAAEAIRLADHKATFDQVPVVRLATKTAKRHFSAMSQMWKWLQPREHVEKNIFSGFVFAGTGGGKSKRDDWSEADLVKLLRSAPFGLEAGQDAPERWLPLIGMYSGLRLEEIARLRPEDIVDIEGILTFKIQEQPGWSPKTAAGERVVPVHPALLDLGVMGLVSRRHAEGTNRLFPDLRPTGPDGKLSAEFSRQFGKRKTALGVGPKTTFHSLRHSVRTILGNTDIKDSWIDAVMGHEGGEKSVGISVYLKRIGITNLATVVAAIRYPDAVTMAVRSDRA